MQTLSSRLLKSPIGRKLTLSIVLFSSLITLITTGIQLINDYKGDLNRIESQFASIEKVNLEVLAASIWVIDERLITTQLNGLIQLPDITYILIHDDADQIWETGISTPTNTIEKRFELVYPSGSETILVGSLLVQANLDAVFDRLLDRTIVILLSNAVKTFLVAGFILFLVWHFVTNNLDRLSQHCQKLDFNKPFIPLTFSKTTNKNDEFVQVASAINTMQTQLRESFLAIKQSKQKLQEALTDRERLLALETGYKEELARQVKKRTKELELSLQALERAQTVLIEQEKMAALGGLVSGVAHEINTPIGICLTAASAQLSNIDRMVEMLHSEDATLEEIDEILLEYQNSCELIVKNITRASDLIQKFKAISAQQTLEENSIVNLRQLIIDLHESIKIFYSQTDVDIEIDIDKELHINTNQALLKQIINNLLSNAYTHAFKDSNDAKLIISAKISHDQLNISVQDNGSGIEREAANKIFEPFYTTSRNEGGAGLGLAAAFNAATQLNGTMHLEQDCELGGACFVVSFPLIEILDKA